MTIINIRGTSGSGKSTLVHRFLAEYPNEEIIDQFGPMKKPKVVGYKVIGPIPEIFVSYTGFVSRQPITPTYIIGRYATACGGCDSMSYKGSHDDIEAMVMRYAALGNVIFEGLTISSTITRWMRVSQAYPGKMVWAFMNTPEEVCYQRIIARSGREPKRDNKGLADYNRKFRGCVVQRQKLIEAGENVIDVASDDEGYRAIVGVLE